MGSPYLFPSLCPLSYGTHRSTLYYSSYSFPNPILPSPFLLVRYHHGPLLLPFVSLVRSSSELRGANGRMIAALDIKSALASCVKNKMRVPKSSSTQRKVNNGARLATRRRAPLRTRLSDLIRWHPILPDPTRSSRITNCSAFEPHSYQVSIYI